MKLWGFVVTASAIAIAAQAATAGASSDINQNTALQDQDSPINHADLLTKPEKGTDFNDWNLHAERAEKEDCSTKNGLCISKTTAKEECSGEIDKKFKCESKKDVCCIPESADCPGLPGVFIQNNGKCFHFSSDSEPPVAASWEEARKNCQMLGFQYGRIADLAELGSQDDCGSNEWLMETITAKGHTVWLGAHDPNENDEWFWVHSGRNLSLGSPFWGPGEPNNHQGREEYCMDTWPIVGRTPPRRYLNDSPCECKKHYVCQLFPCSV